MTKSFSAISTEAVHAAQDEKARDKEGETYPDTSICQADLDKCSSSTVLELDTNLKAYGRARPSQGMTSTGVALSAHKVSKGRLARKAIENTNQEKGECHKPYGEEDVTPTQTAPRKKVINASFWPDSFCRGGKTFCDEQRLWWDGLLKAKRGGVT